MSWPSAAIVTAAEVAAKLIVQTFFSPLSGWRSSFISPLHPLSWWRGAALSANARRAKRVTLSEANAALRRRSAEIWRWHFLWKREWLGLPSPSAVVELLSSSYLAFPSSDIQQGRSSIKRNVLFPLPPSACQWNSISICVCVCLCS